MATTRDVYALLVGIDAYPAPTPPLSGCVNDITAVRRLLENRVATDGGALHVRTLLDADATRAAVVAGFREHLARAGADDVALFYYSGHGSQEPAPPQWWDVEPDHQNETLVLADSRLPGGWDLADKELAALLEEVAARRPHLLVVLDCCHSGSGTRAVVEDGLAARTAPADTRQRPLSSYLLAPHRAADLTAPADERGALGDSGWSLPRTAHVLLSGCRSNETAKETTVDGQVRGAMSAALEQALSTGGAGRTYRDVHRQLSTAVTSTVRQQHPQLETPTAEDLDRPFLGGAVRAQPESFVLTHGARGWVVDGGSVHGLTPATGAETTLLEVRDAAGRVVGTVAVEAVGPGESTVRVVDGELREGTSYRAVVTVTSLPPTTVVIEGVDDAAASLRSALADRDAAGPLLLVEVAPGDGPALVVTASHDGYRVRRPGGERLLAPLAASPAAAVGVLEHLASWLRVSALRNVATRLPSDAVTTAVVAEEGLPEEPHEVDGQYRFPYVTEDDGGSRPRRYTVTLTNTTERDLWVALLDLTDTYGIFADALESGSAHLPPGRSLPVTLQAEVPDALWEQGVTEVTDVLKLVVSTEEFDPRPLGRGDLEVGAALEVAGVRAAPASTLDRLLQHVATRRARPQPAGEPVADWYTRDLAVVSVRPRPGVAVTPHAAVALAAGVRLAPHPTLRATVRLDGSPDATRDLAVPPLPAALRGTQPFALSGTRGDEAEADAVVVEVDGSGVDGVTAEEPLVLQLDRALPAGGHVLPVAWDGEYYVPLGFARAAGTGTEVVLQRLTAPVATRRSLGGSIRILFRRLVGDRLGLPRTYPLLRMARVAADGTVSYEDDRDRIAQEVEAASAVLLYVHGIIGDTVGMARSAVLSGTARPLSSAYPVVLTYDYENIGTSIEENAEHLAQRLARVGLGAGHGKRLDVVAHSMGGLVCRYMIEFVGGVDVRRLVTLGSPYGGSPWPTVQRWATAGVALALNSMTAVAWPLTVLGAVVGAIEKVDTALDQMEGGSPFLRTLAGGKDPGVAYHVVVGNRSLVPGSEDRVDGLLARLDPRRVVDRVVDAAFFRQPNDLAVSVVSARSVPGGRVPAVEITEVATDHMSYFVDPATLERVAQVLLD